MAEHTYAALRAYEKCVAGLMADPQVTGDLLLVGLWLARAVHLKQPEPTSESGTGWQLADIARDVFPLYTQAAINFAGAWVQDQATGPDMRKAAEVLKADIRRYDMWVDQPGPKWRRTLCGGPMVRREVCGKPASTWGTVTDLETGRRRLIGACRKHTGWYGAEMRANRAAVAAAEVPRPAANAGGHLARHIDLDWPALWRGLDPEWVSPPEVESWSRPNLRVLVSDVPVRASDEAPGKPRPRFAVIDGAGS